MHLDLVCSISLYFDSHRFFPFFFPHNILLQGTCIFSFCCSFYCCFHDLSNWSSSSTFLLSDELSLKILFVLHWWIFPIEVFDRLKGYAWISLVSLIPLYRFLLHGSWKYLGSLQHQIFGHWWFRMSRVRDRTEDFKDAVRLSARSLGYDEVCLLTSWIYLMLNCLQSDYSLQYYNFLVAIINFILWNQSKNC